MEGICSKIYHISLEYVKRIREKHLAILKENNIPGKGPVQGASWGAANSLSRALSEGTSKAEPPGHGWFGEARSSQRCLRQALLSFGAGLPALLQELEKGWERRSWRWWT